MDATLLLIVVVGAFLGGWGGWAVFSRRAGRSWTISLGGGFIAGCLAMIFAGWAAGLYDRPTQGTAVAAESQVAPAPVKIAYGPGLGVSYAQMMSGLNELIPYMKDAPLASGEARRMGQSDESKAQAILEVVGNLPARVDRVSLVFSPSPDNAAVNFGNIAVIALVTRNAVPNWPEGPKSVMDSVTKMAKRSKTEDQAGDVNLVHGDVKIKISLIRELGLFTISFTHKSAA